MKSYTSRFAIFTAFSVLFSTSELLAITIKSKPTSITISSAAVGGSGIAGSIDSSLLNRHRTGGNAIYVYAGAVTPNDRGSATSPLAVVPVTQDLCLFSYSVTGLAAGTYTLALTQQADQDAATTDDTISFLSQATVTYSNAASLMSYSFSTKGRVLKVGAGQTYAKLSQAIQNSLNGDVIEISSGDYVDDFATISNSVTLRGVGGTRPHIKRVAGNISNGKGILVTTGKVTVENVEISGAKVADENGAAIRVENDITICNAYIHDNEDGVLGGGVNTLIEYSEFSQNGLTDCGYNHNIYISDGDVFVLKHSYIHDAVCGTDTGHNVKTRAKNNYILYNRIANEATGTASDQINVPQGGLTYIVGNVIRESSKSHSNRIILYYDGGDGAAHASRDLYLINNTIISDNGEAFLTPGGGTTVRAYNNLLWGSPKTISAANQSNNIFSTDTTVFVNKTNYDYHLSVTATTPINAGVNVSTITGFTLPVDFEYVHPTNKKARILNGVIDVGAYER